jgi:serine/threonine protein kinase
MGDPKPRILNLGKEWILGDQIGKGGFGRVYEATSGDQSAAIKLIEKEPGADRELLFVDLPRVRNVIPIIDRGETDNDWALVMPLADMSLEKYLEGAGGPIRPEDVISILNDVAATLAHVWGVRPTSAST